MPLGRRTDYGEARYVGAELGDSDDVERDLDVRGLAQHLLRALRKRDD